MRNCLSMVAALVALATNAFFGSAGAAVVEVRLGATIERTWEPKQLQAWVTPVKPGTPPRVAKAPAAKTTANTSETSTRDDASPWGIASGAEWSGDCPRFNPMLESAGVKWIPPRRKCPTPSCAGICRSVKAQVT